MISAASDYGTRMITTIGESWEAGYSQGHELVVIEGAAMNSSRVISMCCILLLASADRGWREPCHRGRRRRRGGYGRRSAVGGHRQGFEWWRAEGKVGGPRVNPKTATT